MSDVSFGDTVRVLTTVETTNAGIADRIGVVFGVTKPSSTHIVPLGHSGIDIAYNVFFEDTDTDVWLAPHLVAFVDHGAGAVAMLEGVPTCWSRTSSGDWLEEPGGTRHASLFERLLPFMRRFGKRTK